MSTPATHTETTVARMRELRAQGFKPQMMDPDTRATYSADPGDYFAMPEHEPFTNEAGKPMVLVQVTTMIDIL
jgi:hypothetical protein